MDDAQINPSSLHDGAAADGPPSQSPIPNSSLQSFVEASRADQDRSIPIGLEGEESTSAAPNSDAFTSNSMELDSPVDGKMEKVSLTGFSDASYPDGPVADEEGGREESEGGDTDSDEENSEEQKDDSENEESSSEESDSSTSTSSEEEEDVAAANNGDGGEGPEDVPFGSDDEEEVLRGPIKSRNELEVLPPVPHIEASLEPRHQTFPVGVISSILGSRVIVESSVDHKPLNEGSILWIAETKSPLGVIDEIFGPVKNPYYVVRYNSDKDVPAGISEGTAVSFAIEFANYVLEKDLKKGGYDASGENDEEISDEVEFSDDEKEAEYKKSLRQAKRGSDGKKFENQENGNRKKKTNFKGAGPQKGMVLPVPHGLEALDRPVSSVRGPCVTPSRARNSDSGKSLFSSQSARASENASPMIQMVPQGVSLGGGLANPSHRLLQQPNTILGHGVSHPQQPNAFLAHGMPMPLQQQQQLLQNAVWPLAIPAQQQLNVILPHGMPLQQQQSAAVRGFQMNCLPNQWLGNEAYLHQRQNQGFSDNQTRLLSPQQILQMLGMPDMPWLGAPLNSSTGLMPPVMVGQAGTSQASLVPSEQGVSWLGNHQSHVQSFPDTIQGGMSPLQFNPGNSSVGRRAPHQRGSGHSFRQGTRR